MLADEGCPVAIVARKRADIDAAVEDVQHRGGEAMGIPADITRRADVDDAVRQVRDNFGPPLIVIGQTKYLRTGDFADITDPQPYRESFEAYTISQFHLLHAVLPGMVDAGWGRYVHIGSATAKEPPEAFITWSPTPPVRRPSASSRRSPTSTRATGSASTR
ncbi:short chain dehydrogenase family protein [Mycobacterium xenopi 3993]|nr:short chain dehydrogenase family protein [Mycobacterium xenopi 3993]